MGIWVPLNVVPPHRLSTTLWKRSGGTDSGKSDFARLTGPLVPHRAPQWRFFVGFLRDFVTDIVVLQPVAA